MVAFDFRVPRSEKKATNILKRIADKLGLDLVLTSEVCRDSRYGRVIEVYNENYKGYFSKDAIQIAFDVHLREGRREEKPPHFTTLMLNYMTILPAEPRPDEIKLRKQFEEASELYAKLYTELGKHLRRR